MDWLRRNLANLQHIQLKKTFVVNDSFTDSLSGFTVVLNVDNY